jgi:hypothetical protein
MQHSDTLSESQIVVVPGASVQGAKQYLQPDLDNLRLHPLPCGLMGGNSVGVVGLSVATVVEAGNR